MSALVATLSAPLVELKALLGTGRSEAPGDAATILRGASHALQVAATAGAGAAQRIGERWTGLAADVAVQSGSAASTATHNAASRSAAIAARVDAAAQAVDRARTDLQRIIDDFAAAAHLLEGDLPQSAPSLVASARTALDDAIAVITGLQTELDKHTGTVRALAESASHPAGAAPITRATSALPNPGTTRAPPMPVAAPPMSFPTPALPISTQAPPIPLASAIGGWSDPPPLNEYPTMEPEALGAGAAIKLPDGTTVLAPNAVAADAVRHALTQLGVPYRWGGTTPDVGLDCSGLTQWAYRQAGLELPRLAQDQDVGTAVPHNQLLPGDLAVWDGHVAMIVGNDLMIEAGDPVQLSSIRATNAGQGFQGFFRPTV